MFEVASLADLVLRLERAWTKHTPERLRSSVTGILAGARARVSIDGSGFALALADRPSADPLPALCALLDLPSQLAKREPGRTLVVLDECQFIAGVPEAAPLIWSHSQDHRMVVSYLFSGVGPRVLTAASGGLGHPNTGQVETLHLDRLPAGELMAAIRCQFAAADRDVSDVLAGLLSASENHPQRAMLLAQMLAQNLRTDKQATADHLEAAIAAALRWVGPEVRAVLGGLTIGQRKALRAVAEYGTPMAARALRSLGLPKTTAQKAVPHLVATGIVEEVDREWRVIDPLLARWIRTNYGTRA
ncbi:hypothetical protein [Streptomyces cyaneofuscatus]|uniref:hypothetical protein n=1 Tax=Streptomyces cyaneofuscatus TaxID=66883 RepID=UPI003329D513